MGIASLVLGIVAILLSFIPFIQLIATMLGVIGLVLGAASRKQSILLEKPTGISTAGMICSGNGIGITLLMYVACSGLINSVVNH